MAKAEMNYELVLTLSKEEAEALAAITASVGGDFKTTRRKYADSINTALIEAGVEENTSDTDGNVYFK